MILWNLISLLAVVVTLYHIIKTGGRPLSTESGMIAVVFTGLWFVASLALWSIA